MATDSRQLLLDSFADNQIQSITAADMRSFVNAVYDELLNKLDVRDDLGTQDPDKALSAMQGVELKTLIDDLQQEIETLKRKVQALEGISGTNSTFSTTDDLVVRVENGIVAEVYRP